ncbi:MAG: amidohydrolase family protein [Planctomycetota bacterium]|nr:amidohydrolase family protein [Planctomycetota bacterium]
MLVDGGRIVRLARSAAAVRRARREAGRELDLGELVLAPGLVNAHAHLELTGLAGRLPARKGFSAWIGALLQERAARTVEELARDAARGAEMLLATGTTTVGDVDSTGAGARACRGGGPRVVLYREVLDAWDPERTEEALRTIRRALPRRSRRVEGISPHAPFTTSRELLSGVAVVRRRRNAPVSVHWSETRAEVEWLEHGRGELAALLPASPRRRGLALLEEAGLLDASLSLIHGNHPARGEPARVAAAGATLVHCPGTHAFFGREPFPWRRWAAAGVRLALGTDSLASNHELDLRREMALFRAAAPGLAPADVFAMATTGGARALGLAGEVGELRCGAWADLVAYRLHGATAAAALEELTCGGGEVVRAWIGGRRVRSPRSLT